MVAYVCFLNDELVAVLPFNQGLMVKESEFIPVNPVQKSVQEYRRNRNGSQILVVFPPKILTEKGVLFLRKYSFVNMEGRNGIVYKMTFTIESTSNLSKPS